MRLNRSLPSLDAVLTSHALAHGKDPASAGVRVSVSTDGLTLTVTEPDSPARSPRKLAAKELKFRFRSDHDIIVRTRKDEYYSFSYSVEENEFWILLQELHYRQNESGFWKVILGWGGTSAVVLLIASQVPFGRLARYIPWEWEAKLAEWSPQTVGKVCHSAEVQSQLVDTSFRIVNQLGLSEGYDLPLKIVLIDEEIPNAFAGLGGTIYLTKGLLRAIPDPMTLFPVVAHEIGHLQRRHLIQGWATRNVGTLSEYIWGAALPGMDWLIRGATWLGVQDHSRDLEREADEFAIALVTRMGHSPETGAETFRQLEKISNAVTNFRIPTLLSSHPDFAERIARWHSAPIPETRLQDIPFIPWSMIEQREWLEKCF